jgi:hypothetical protein
LGLIVITSIEGAALSRTARPLPRRKLDLDFRPAAYRWPRRRADGTSEALVARIALSTPHRAQISLRARRGKDGRLRFTMLHEDGVGAARRIRVSPASSSRPLSLGELVAMLDGACYHAACADPGDQARFGGVIWGTLQLHFDHGIDHADDYVSFVRVTSDHYPELERYYLDRLSEWCLENCEEAEDCKRIVRLRARRS